MANPPPMQDNNGTVIMLIRHADVYNPHAIVYGRLPRFGLSEVGRRQAAELARYLAGQQVAAMYTSPQLRARQTAAILNQAVECPTIHVSRMLSEVLTGYEGSPESILSSKKGKFNFYDELARPGDETIGMIASRMTRFLSLAHRRHQGETVIAVSHADPIMILRAGVLGLPLVIESLRGPNYPAKCSITKFSFTDASDVPSVEYLTPVKDETLSAEAKEPGPIAAAAAL
ncbi:MAG TPA: histidine phosphatase family protein [Chloroflexota bacterium]|nr:histidine phosphatase family protein [Chloroflexota bacterium]